MDELGGQLVCVFNEHIGYLLGEFSITYTYAYILGDVLGMISKNKHD